MYTLLPAQREFLHVDDPAVKLDVVCYQGGFGSGKSFIGSFLGLELARKYPGSTGLVGADTLKRITKTTLESYFDHLMALGFVYGKDYTHNKSEHILTLHCYGGSKILLLDLDDPLKLRSLNLAWAHIEEGSLVSEAAFIELVGRLRQGGVGRYRLFITTNPQSKKGWIHKYFVDKQGEATFQHDGKVYQIQYRRVLAPSTENTNLSPVFLASMKDLYDPEYYRINVLGQDGDYTAGLVCKHWSFANIDNTIEYEESHKLYLSCDFNVDPMAWVVAHRYNGEYRYIDEIVIENTNIIEAAAEFAARYGDHKSGIIITGDASGKNRTDAGEKPQDTRYKILNRELSNLGVRNFALDLRTANPYVENRIQSWNAMVCNSQGVRRIKVHPCCKWLIYNMENLSYIPGTSVVQLPTPNDIKKDNNQKFLGHPFDAASYLVERYDPISKLQDRRAPKPRMVAAQSLGSRFG